jgi:ABC-2 type transport system ATP-binding protein
MIIEVKNLRKEFKIRTRERGIWRAMTSTFVPRYRTVEAVSDISLSVAEGEIVAFIGPNGAGKSTTIKMLTGILTQSSGSISVLGFHPAHDRQKLAFRIGTVFGQRSQLWFHLPPSETFELFARVYELEYTRYKQRRDFLIDAFQIRSYLETPVRKLSLGERMRCEIVASLLHEPKILFLDEPTIGLDVVAKQQIREVIRHMNEKERVTVFLTSHDAGDIEALADRTVVINHGKIVFDGATAEFGRRYINSKTVEVITAAPLEEFSFEGATILERDPCRLKLSLDLARGNVEDLLYHALRAGKIIDINIYEPELEAIIADIYRTAAGAPMRSKEDPR